MNDYITVSKAALLEEYEYYLNLLAQKEEKDDSYWFMKGKFHMLNLIIKGHLPFTHFQLKDQEKHKKQRIKDLEKELEQLKSVVKIK